ncbi:MAG: TRAP transporter small permease [Steroidobacteraceae bacterium]
MRRFSAALTALSAALDRACVALALAAFMVMLLAILLQVVARYVFAMPPTWTDELARYAMIWGAMPGAAMSYARGVDPVLKRLDCTGRPGRALAIQAIEGVAMLVFILPVLWYTPGFLARHAHRITESLELNSAVVVSIIPASLVVVLVHMAARLAKCVLAWQESRA